MVIFGGSRGGGRRGGWGRRPGFGGGYAGGFGRGYGGGGYRGGDHGRRGGGGGGCLRDLFLLNTGCCLAESLGGGVNLALLAPMASVHQEWGHGPVADRLVGAIRLYQREVSPKRAAVCHVTPSCSEFGAQALQTHGARRGTRLLVGRLLRCRPGGRYGHDPMPR